MKNHIFDKRKRLSKIIKSDYFRMGYPFFIKGYSKIEPFFILEDYRPEINIKKNKILLKKYKDQEIILNKKEDWLTYLEQLKKNECFLTRINLIIGAEEVDEEYVDISDYRYINLFDFLIVYSIENFLYHRAVKHVLFQKNSDLLNFVFRQYKNNKLTKKQTIYLLKNFSDYDDFLNEDDIVLIIDFIMENNLGNPLNIVAARSINLYSHLFLEFVERKDLNFKNFLLNSKDSTADDFSEVIAIIFDNFNKGKYVGGLNKYELFELSFMIEDGYYSELEINNLMRKEYGLDFLYYLIASYLQKQHGVEHEDDILLNYIKDNILPILNNYTNDIKEKRKIITKLNKRLWRIRWDLWVQEEVKVNQYLLNKKNLYGPNNFEIIIDSIEGIKQILDILDRVWESMSIEISLRQKTRENIFQENGLACIKKTNKI